MIPAQTPQADSDMRAEQLLEQAATCRRLAISAQTPKRAAALENMANELEAEAQSLIGPTFCKRLQ